MRDKKLTIIGVLAFFSVFTLLSAFLVSDAAHAASPRKLETAWQAEHETFLVWYAKERGWDKEVGLDLRMLRYDSGRSIIEGVRGYEWVVAGCGAMPALLADHSDKVDIVAVANDESAANALMARPDSPVLRRKGWNPAFPEVHGSPDTVRGATILCPGNTSARYMLDKWLAVLGLTEKDVQIRDMELVQAMIAFKNGYGDMIALWAPFTYKGEQNGWKTVALSGDCNARQPVLIVANRAAAAKQPEAVTAFLKMYFRVVDVLKKEQPETLAPDYVRFYKEWSGMDMPIKEAVADLRAHPVFSLDEQLGMFGGHGINGSLEVWLTDIVNFSRNMSAAHADKEAVKIPLVNTYLRNVKP